MQLFRPGLPGTSIFSGTGPRFFIFAGPVPKIWTGPGRQQKKSRSRATLIQANLEDGPIDLDEIARGRGRNDGYLGEKGKNRVTEKVCTQKL